MIGLYYIQFQVSNNTITVLAMRHAYFWMQDRDVIFLKYLQRKKNKVIDHFVSLSRSY